MFLISNEIIMDIIDSNSDLTSEIWSNLITKWTIDEIINQTRTNMKWQFVDLDINRDSSQWKELNSAYEEWNLEYTTKEVNKDVNWFLDKLIKKPEDVAQYVISIKQKFTLSNYRSYLRWFFEYLSKRLLEDASLVSEYQKLFWSNWKMVLHMLWQWHHEKYLRLLDETKSKTLHWDLSEEHMPRELSDEEIVKLELNYIIHSSDSLYR